MIIWPETNIIVHFIAENTACDIKKESMMLQRDLSLI